MIKKFCEQCCKVCNTDHKKICVHTKSWNMINRHRMRSSTCCMDMIKVVDTTLDELIIRTCPGWGGSGWGPDGVRMGSGWGPDWGSGWGPDGVSGWGQSWGPDGVKVGGPDGVRMGSKLGSGWGGSGVGPGYPGWGQSWGPGTPQTGVRTPLAGVGPGSLY